MPMTLSGDGTITGLAAGGLPNGTVQPSDLSTGAPTWDTSGNLTPTNQIRGSATGVPPLLADSAGNTATLRAWVNFNGTTSPGTIRASFNVSSVTKNGTGDYTVNLTNAMPDTNYCIVESVNQDNTSSTSANGVFGNNRSLVVSTSAYRLIGQVRSGANGLGDATVSFSAIFR